MQSPPVHMSIPEDPRSTDHMKSSRIKPAAGIFSGDSSADLQPAWICPQRLLCLSFVPSSEHDHMTPFQVILSIKSRVPGSRTVRNKICAYTLGSAQRAADNLLHFAFMKID